DVEVELPAEGRSRGRHVHCNGVVVECRPAYFDSGYDVTLLFLEPDKRTLSELARFSRHQTRSTAQRGAAFASAGV
ncbi:MAG: hypothetical protein N2689_04030, partial [Verrucomicrobiae bacterium]|nr:hypothetical protein [Verrucomicrobiae bacterium]